MAEETVSNREHIDELGKMLQLITELHKQQKPVGDEREILFHEKKELGKALRCLCSLLSLIEHGPTTLDGRLKEALGLIQEAWQYPDETSGRIILDEKTYITSNFIIETEWKHEAEITINGQAVGRFELFYMEKTPDEFTGLLMWERPEMVQAFASGLGVIINDFRLHEKYDSLQQGLEQAKQVEKKYAAKIARNLPKLRKLKQMADDSVKAANCFLGTISKELLKSVNTILEAMAEAPQNENDNTEDRRQIIKASATHMSHIIKRIHDYAEIETKPFKQINNEFNLHELFEETVEPLHTKAQAKGIDLINFTGILIPANLTGDAGKLKTILSNLIENAINRSSGGEIAIGVELEATPHLLPIFHFIVADSGPALDEEEQKRLFEPFDIAQTDSSSHDTCCRLGRAISKKLVELMGGEIWVDNYFFYDQDNHEGTTIHFTMWMDIAASSAPTIPLLQSNGTLSNPVMIVENNSIYKRYFQALFDNSDIKSLFVDNFDQAVAFLKSDEYQTPAIIIRGNHHEIISNTLIEYIKSDTKAKDIEIIAIDETMPDDIADMPEDISIYFLTKPIRQNELLNRLSAIISKYNAQKTQTTNEPEDIPEHTIDITKKPAHESPERLPVRVLLSDRDDSKRTIVEKLLRKRNFTVDLFSDGRQAIDMIRTGQYNILVIDIDTPIIDGFEVIRLVRAWERENHTFIAIAALIDSKNEPDCQICYDAGADTCLEVDADIKQMLKTIEKLARPFTEPTPEQTDIQDIQFDGINRFDTEGALRLVGGDADILLELLEIFGSDSRALLERLEKAISAEDTQTTIAIAEEIGKTAKSVGANVVHLLAQHLTTMAGDNLSNAETVFNRLVEEVSAFNREARIFEQSYLQEGSASS